MLRTARIIGPEAELCPDFGALYPGGARLRELEPISVSCERLRGCNRRRTHDINSWIGYMPGRVVDASGNGIFGTRFWNLYGAIGVAKA